MNLLLVKQLIPKLNLINGLKVSQLSLNRIGIKSIENNEKSRVCNRFYHNNNYNKKSLDLMVRNRLLLSSVLSTKQSLREFAHKPPLTYDFIRERILLLLKLYDKIDPQKLTLDSHFYNDLGLDSLDHVEVIMALEDEFHFEIPDCDAEKLLTPRDVLKYVSDKEEAYEGLQHNDEHHEHH